MSRLIRYSQFVLMLLVLGLFITPLFSHAATFENPLGTEMTDIRTVIMSLTRWLVRLSALIAILALVFGGMRLIIGGFGNEQEAVAAKKIITWAIIGLFVVGLAAIILWTIRSILVI
ncbi:MAG: hypothetical protein A3I08_00595 [Candidatus Andersenbacteria bacterium RIFCSPLOWO2_02_FULL_46_11]|nr:MAG: hypothetical protein UW94_C0012G0009 [Parcubacteria group bacterium GW2011_GWA2_45_14]OGY37667.1 MAG: hypothetical protein A3I08_00595 [Candidatus Andersenbacteria bacterium RIFCSPLOWO2_02_FULL_46_11]